MGLVAVSLCVRTAVYAVGRLATGSADASRIVWVPAWLVAGRGLRDRAGLGLLRPDSSACPGRRCGGRFLAVFLRRGRSVCLIQLSQAVIGSADLLVVGLMSPWADVGLLRRPAPDGHGGADLRADLPAGRLPRPVADLAGRRRTRAGGRSTRWSRCWCSGLVPIAVGATSWPSRWSGCCCRRSTPDAALLLALGIWRAPLLSLAFLYQTALIALNRESAGRPAAGLAARSASAPLVAVARLAFGLAGGGGGRPADRAGPGGRPGMGAWPARGGSRPWHHHLAKPAGRLAGDGPGLPGLAALARRPGRAGGGGRRTWWPWRRSAGFDLDEPAASCGPPASRSRPGSAPARRGRDRTGPTSGRSWYDAGVRDGAGRAVPMDTVRRRFSGSTGGRR